VSDSHFGGCSLLRWETGSRAWVRDLPLFSSSLLRKYAAKPVFGAIYFRGFFTGHFS